MRTALLTGFGPFPGAPVNPTGSVIEAVKAQPPEGWRIETLIFETTFASVPSDLDNAARTLSPDLVVLTGLAAEAQRIRLEVRARNAVLPGRPDAAGRCWTPGPIEPGGPEERRTRLDLDALAEAVKAAGADVEVSEDAGRYVCEFTYYLALGRFSAPAVFVHLPMTGTPGAALTAAEAADALRAVIAAAARFTR
ncbi:MAG: hypothetical protein ABL308_05240 [Oceanicaulis sp.]